MRGRKPKPAALHILHGNPSIESKATLAARAAAEPYHPPPEELAPFDDLTDDQRAVWLDAVSNAPPNILGHIDRWALRTWVIACDLHRQACKAQQGTKLLIKTTKDDSAQLQFVPSPYLAIINKQALIMLKAAGELGFTPSSRPRLYVADVPPGGLPAIGRARLHSKPSVNLETFLHNAPTRPAMN